MSYSFILLHYAYWADLEIPVVYTLVHFSHSSLGVWIVQYSTTLCHTVSLHNDIYSIYFHGNVNLVYHFVAQTC
jgi:hypothetical protein